MKIEANALRNAIARYRTKYPGFECQRLLDDLERELLDDPLTQPQNPRPVQPFSLGDK
ncbi:hypothetical protein [Thermoleptolyngbya sp. M55_K2018_002]|uniref:hypothetical protein n=1 Tax=Thermoleptolyngbya sp. M55_K2018_002 TaxID=2747808 RepID=UPI0019F51606|nr:hypothetical protein [Thermoleptolyngbya sp. M55_K2018_002]HIK42130.1 hypothetical protein [Thermoleptolyngbya sp. M55_K2018_002]